MNVLSAISNTIFWALMFVIAMVSINIKAAILIVFVVIRFILVIICVNIGIYSL